MKNSEFILRKKDVTVKRKRKIVFLFETGLKMKKTIHF
ncbi:hypothetical protein LEP1GSC089_1614 [Leptospira interrogans serovar Autumnalis str. LP101]|nr:hypothetical protein LEP1GSC089_1614 [Leptospira interrogans serovar Autumnalis str. LP101]EMN82273.1 hypothetical protein LEP1GSC106_3701 [Leptospira interrogans serovar Grippotyphosa str. UI 12764]